MKTIAAASLLFQLVSSHGPATNSPHPPAGSPATAAGGLSWKVPAGWSQAPSPSSMRVATHRVPAAAGDAEPGELAVFYFGEGQGGDVASNIARWQSQLSGGPTPPAPRKTTVSGISVTLVSAEGTYSSGMPGGATTPKPGWALLGAIAEGPRGAVFFKLVGPKKTVEKASPGFDALVKSLKKGS